MAKACHMHVVSGVLLISLHLCTVTLINGTLNTLKRRQTQCPCDVNTYVECSARSLDSIPSCIPTNVTGLRLLQNRISHLEDFAFAGMHSLTYLNLLGNRISHIEDFAFAGLHSLTDLVLYANNISHINDFAFAGLHNLTKLDIGTNSLTTITRGMFVNLTNVITLDLSKNRISHIEDFAFAGMHSLTVLFIGGNNLMTITRRMFENLTNVENLRLENNRISHIEDFAFAGMHSLTELYLNDNNLQTITREMFADLRSIQTIDLRHNVDLQLHDVICTFKHKGGFLLKQYPGKDHYMIERECSCHYVNIQLRAMSDCTSMTRTNLTSVLWNNSSFCSTVNSSMSERCQESDDSTSSTYRDETTSDVSTSSTYRDETTSASKTIINPNLAAYIGGAVGGILMFIIIAIIVILVIRRTSCERKENVHTETGSLQRGQTYNKTCFQDSQVNFGPLSVQSISDNNDESCNRQTRRAVDNVYVSTVA